MKKKQKGNDNMNENNFYTLKGYKTKNNKKITEAMEDYIEMIYRETKNKEISIKHLSELLHVKPASTSKMINRLKKLKLVNFEKYSKITLTTKGIKKGKYLMWRHKTLEQFLKKLNKHNYKLEQIEKIEHYIDHITLINIKNITKNI